MRFIRTLSIAAAAATLSACSYDCGTVRGAVAKGTIKDASGTTLGSVTADVTEHIGPRFIRLSVGVIGPPNAGGAPLRGHVTRARFVDAAGELLAEIPVSTATLYSEAVVALNLDLSSVDEYTRVREAILGGQTRVILETNLAGREMLQATLTETQDVPGEINRCSPY